MNIETAFIGVVFPDPVPPEKMSERLFSMAGQKYAICSALKLPD
jgi:hypothetical protein